MEWYSFEDRQPRIGEEVLILEDIRFTDEIFGGNYEVYSAIFQGKKFDYYADEYLITLSNFKSYPDKYPWDFSPREIDINFVFWARLH